jgi:hypothetical protein
MTKTIHALAIALALLTPGCFTKSEPARTDRVELAMSAPIVEHGYLWVQHRAKDGQLKWEGPAHNALTYWGQQRILKCYLTATGCPTSSAHYIALLTATPAGKGTAFGSELASGGYGRGNVAGWTCTSNAASDNSCNSGTVSFTNGSGSTWTAVTAMAVVDTASGAPSTLGYISYIALSTTRTLLAGDTLQIAPYTLTLQ